VSAAAGTESDRIEPDRIGPDRTARVVTSLASSGRAILCAVSDRSRLSAPPGVGLDGLVARLAAAAAAGVDLLQIREPDLSARDLMALVERVLLATQRTGARLVVNDRLDVALAAGAHGVHLKGESIDTLAARRLVPDGFLVGRSAHAVAEAEGAGRDGADYVILGTVFETMSKPGHVPEGGLERLRDAVARCPVPVLAIGGVTEARAREVAGTGAAGLAAIGLFMGPGGTVDQVARRLETTVAAIRRAFAPESEDRPWP
jgi:thiamine-phosphate diphosphorylase